MGTQDSPPSRAEKRARLDFYCADVAETTLSEHAQLGDGPVIASVNSPESFETALLAPTRTLYILTGNPLTLPTLLTRARDCGKLCLVNMDFLDGLARDRFAVEFLAASGAAGIVSTRFESLKAARNLGMVTVQRTFAIDTAAVAASKKSLAQFLPNAIEVLPAMVAPRVGKELREANPNLTIIGGGLIESVREIEELLSAGVDAITTSNPRLWLI